MSEEKYKVSDDVVETQKNYINYLFHTVLNRDAKVDELEMFLNHLNGDKPQWFSGYLNYVNEEDRDYQNYIRYRGRYFIQYIVFEYILRVDNLFFYKEVE